MLSTSPRSRRRLATGGALVSTLVLAGLGLTASGTSAAAALTGKVGGTIGIDLQAAPPVPPVPATPTAPSGTVEAPEPPAALDTPAVQRKIKRVVVNRTDKDGKVRTYTSAADGTFDDREIQQMVDRSIKMAPEVTERDCTNGQDGGAKQVVVHTIKGEKRTMVICTNRIEAMVSAGVASSVNADQIRRNAMQTALASVQASRAGIATNREMSEVDRKEALAEMDQALAELRSEMASPDKD